MPMVFDINIKKRNMDKVDQKIIHNIKNLNLNKFDEK